MRRTVRWLVVGSLSLLTAFAAQSVFTNNSAPLPMVPRSPAETQRLIEVFSNRVSVSAGYPDLMTLGTLYLERARVDGDLADYESARATGYQLLDTDRDDPDALILTAQSELALHQFEMARNLGMQAVAAEPENGPALAVSVDALLALGDVQTSRTFLDRLERLVTGDPGVLLRKAEFQWLVGDVEAAAASSRSALELAKELVADEAALGIYFSHAARIAGATGYHLDAIEILEDAPPIATVLHQRARAMAATGDLVGAISVLEEAVALRPDPSFLMDLGLAYEIAGDYERAAAIDATMDAIGRLDSAGVYDRVISQWLSDRGLDPARALALAESDPRRDPGSFDTLAWALLRAGRAEDAREASDEALASGSADPSILLHSALIWSALGEDEKAGAALATVAALDPPFPPKVAREALEGWEAEE